MLCARNNCEYRLLHGCTQYELADKEDRITCEMDPYKREGFKNRREYLEDLADQWGVPTGIVTSLAAALGPGEDFDGLVSELEAWHDEQAILQYVGSREHLSDAEWAAISGTHYDPDEDAEDYERNTEWEAW
jgi:hypothetical protein